MNTSPSSPATRCKKSRTASPAGRKWCRPRWPRSSRIAGCSVTPGNLLPRQSPKLRLPQHLDSQVPGLPELAPRLFAREEIGRLFTHRADHLPAALADDFRDLLARTRERAGDDPRRLFQVRSEE